MKNCCLFNSPADGKEVKHSPCIHSNFKDSWKFGTKHGINIGSVCTQFCNKLISKKSSSKYM